MSCSPAATFSPNSASVGIGATQCMQSYTVVQNLVDMTDEQHNMHLTRRSVTVSMQLASWSSIGVLVKTSADQSNAAPSISASSPVHLEPQHNLDARQDSPHLYHLHNGSRAQH